MLAGRSRDTQNKAKESRFDEIRPCIRCMQGCLSTTYLQIPLRCCVNPELGNEYKYTVENKPQPKKVLIIGGGPGGMEAAIAATRMGHAVTLWEKENQLVSHQRDRDVTTKLIPYDAVIVSMGYHANNGLANVLKDELGDKMVVIGDAVQPSNAMDAGLNGFDVGYYI